LITAENAAAYLQLDEVVSYLGDEFTAVLGNSVDYAIGYQAVEPLGGNLSHRKVFVAGKSEFDPAALNRLIRDTETTLTTLQLDIRLQHSVLRKVIDRIELECAVHCREVDGRTERVEDAPGYTRVFGASFEIRQDGPHIISGVFRAYPFEVSEALSKLKELAKKLIIYDLQSEVRALPLADQDLEVKRRLNQCQRQHTDFREAYEIVLGKLKKEVQFQQEYKTIRESTGIDDAQLNETDRPNQFTRKQTIYLLQELIPEFMTADNTRKAEFITLLTGYISTKNIADEFSNIRNFADPGLLEEWRSKFKSSGRGRKKNNP